MRPFHYEAAIGRREALKAAARPETQYLAGGTTLVDLMKLDVLHPAVVVDINALASEHGAIRAENDQLKLGALVRMAEAAAHPEVRQNYPAIAQSLDLAASQQIRNMATLGGNVLQRTRCSYFRDPSWTSCNKREPGSGCAAINGVNRGLGVLGVSANCVANYPGDLAVVLAALGATVDVESAAGLRVIAFEDLHRLPGETPHIETNLKAGELITGFNVPAGPWTRRSLYLKIRDRASYEFALASAVVALDLDGAVVREIRIGVGGVAAKPWRSHAAEAALKGQKLTQAAAEDAAKAALVDTVTHGGNDFKPELARRTLVRALLQAQTMEV
jgi:xanthine dehydrogenase YagS FAD-binding subunit